MSSKPILKTSKQELAYRAKHFHDIRVKKDKLLTCVSCGNRINLENGKIFCHPVMGTLQCEQCMDYFNTVDFSSNQDHFDKYCRICGHSNNLHKCNSLTCSFAFCERCIKRNANLALLNVVAGKWKCFLCDPKPFWELRAVCAAVLETLPKKKKKILLSDSQKRLCYNIRHTSEDNSPEAETTLTSKSDGIEQERNICTLKKKEQDYKNIVDVSPSSSDSTIFERKIQKKNLKQRKVKVFQINTSDNTSDTDQEQSNESPSKFTDNESLLQTGRYPRNTKENIQNLVINNLYKRRSSNLPDVDVCKGSNTRLNILNKQIFNSESNIDVIKKMKKHCINKSINKNKTKQKYSSTEYDEESTENDNTDNNKRNNNHSIKKYIKSKSINEQEVKRNKEVSKCLSTDSDTESNSSKEFQKLKICRKGYSSMRKLYNNTRNYDISSKADCSKANTSENINIIDEQKEIDVKSHFFEVLDEFKRTCLMLGSQIEYIKNSYRKRETKNLGNTHKVIYKSKNIIHALKMDLDEKQTNFINFYNSWYKNCKEQRTFSQKSRKKSKKDNFTDNKKCNTENGNNSRDSIISEYDSSEIFSATDTKYQEDINTSSKKTDTLHKNIDIKSSDTENSEYRRTHTATSNISHKTINLSHSRSSSPIFEKCVETKNNCEDLNNKDKSKEVTNDMTENTCDVESDNSQNLVVKENATQKSSTNVNTQNVSIVSASTINDSLKDVFDSTESNDGNNETTVGPLNQHHTSELEKSIEEEHDDIISNVNKDNNSTFCNNKILTKKQEHCNDLSGNKHQSQKISKEKKIEVSRNNTKECNIDQSGELVEKKNEIEHGEYATDDSNDLLNEQCVKKFLLESDSDLSNDSISLENTDETLLNDSTHSQKRELLDNSKKAAGAHLTGNRESEIYFSKEKSSQDNEECTSEVKNNNDVEQPIKKRLLKSDSEDSEDNTFNSKKKKSKNKTIDNKDQYKSDDNIKNLSTKEVLLVLSNSDNSSFDEETESQIIKSKIHKKKVKFIEHDNQENISVPSKMKNQKLQLHTNRYYQTYKQLRMICQVKLERLQRNILVQHKLALQKSKEYQEQRRFKSLMDLDGLERNYKKKKYDKKNENSKKNIKQGLSIEDTDDTLMDHFEKVKNNEIIINEESNNKQDINRDREINAPLTTQNLMSEADIAVKKLLLNSCDSDLGKNVESSDEIMGSDEDKSVKINNKNNKKVALKESQENEEKEESEKMAAKQQKAKQSRWKKDKILTKKFLDTDSESETEMLKKYHKKLNKKDEDSNQDVDGMKKKHVKVKKKMKRRILDSDSDIKTDADSTSDTSSSVSDMKTSSDSKSTNKGRLKRKRSKRDTNKSSDTDSSSAEKKPKQKRKRIKVKTDSDSDSEKVTSSQTSPNKAGRKNIRKVLKDKQVTDNTKQAAKEEEERIKRIAERQKLYNEMYEVRLAGEKKIDKLVLDFDPETKEELVSVHQNLVKRLKPHQAEGIKFMWNACFESLERIKTSSGSGCIIAHCMGLGKTLQVITLAHTLLTHEETGIKTILVVCPLSTVLNWVNEFRTWLKNIDDDIEIYELIKWKKISERKYRLQSWKRTGGIFIIGYEMFRNLCGPSKGMRKALKEALLECLVDPGPDLIVCDEGHLLKKEDTALSKCMKQVKTLRRIVLTGTPLQNNLKEYYCMVQFVKPNLLGTYKEFLNRFVNPINNGQFDNSTQSDVKLMKKRAHVLHKMLEGSIQRFDYSVLTPFLPPKQEYVIFVKLTDVQIKMYQHYLDNFARKLRGEGGSLFADFQVLQRIWTHPIVLRLNEEKIERANEKKRYISDSENSMENFINDESTDTDSSDSRSDIQSINDEKEAAPISKPRTRSNIDGINSESEPEEIPIEKEETWWSQYVQPEHLEDLRISVKLVLLFGILKECEKIGDKVLVFSQSLYSLTLIEEFLEKINEDTQAKQTSENLDYHNGNWWLDRDYFRLDGQTSAENRNNWCKIFNNPSNTRARLFLISTRAGGLGINLTAANRVIIFDASWNPSHDVQSIFRIYRFGQKKPCYIYRFLASGTMEEKIYNRQVTKLSLSCRVVDEQQIERHYSNNDLAELYTFESGANEKEKPTLNLPKDRLLAEIFLKYKDLVENYHEHDSLLENKAEEELDEEERKEAWLEYEQEKKGRAQPHPTMSAYQNNLFLQQCNMMMQQNPMHIDYENLQKLIQKDYPNMTPEQQNLMTTKALRDMYTYWEQQAVIQPLKNAVIPQNLQQRVTPVTTNNMNTLQQMLQRQAQLGQQMTYIPQNISKNMGTAPVRELIPNPYAYQNASTSDSVAINDDVQIVTSSDIITTPIPQTTTQPNTSGKEQEE